MGKTKTMEQLIFNSIIAPETGRELHSSDLSLVLGEPQQTEEGQTLAYRQRSRRQRGGTIRPDICAGIYETAYLPLAVGPCALGLEELSDRGLKI